jgi:biopolymer transport protein ExbD
MMVGARSTQSCEINVTPLIESSEKNPETSIVIQLKDVGESHRPLLKINQEEVSWGDLESRLAAVFKLRVDRVAFVKGDPNVDFEYVVQAVDISHRAGADRIGLSVP